MQKIKKLFYTKFLGKFHKFFNGTTGAMMPEFAIAALPYLLVVFGTLQVGMLYWANLELENATNDAARLVLTGQQPDENTFKQYICSKSVMLNISNCQSALTVDIRPLNGGFSTIDTGFNPLSDDEDQSNGNNNSTYQNINGDSVAIVTVFYRWSPIVGILRGNLTNGDYALRASVAMRTEPFTSVSPFQFASSSSGGSIEKDDRTLTVPTLTRAVRQDEFVETALMLDITGSMSGDLASLKTAASSFVTTLLPSGSAQSSNNGLKKVRIALVPYSENVNVQGIVGSVRKASARIKKIQNNNAYFRYANNCVSERVGAANFNDAAPDSQARKLDPVYIPLTTGPGSQTEQIETILTPLNNNANPTIQDIANLPDSALENLLSEQQFLDLTDYLASIGDCEDGPNDNSSVVPLTDNSTFLTDRINSLTTNGFTAGHLGTAWAWYTLSPNWASIWPADNQPQPYNTPNLTKIAVLMTDGQYNIDYTEGIDSFTLGSNSPNGNSDTQADSLCANMKAAGITVYAIFYGPTSTDPNNKTQAELTMEQCATSTTNHFFTPSTTDELQTAFSDIAQEINKLRLSK